MELAPPDLEKLYRRFLEGRGDPVDSLVSLVRDNPEERSAPSSWAALLLSRIYILKGRLHLASSYLRISEENFASSGTRGIPLGVFVNRAIILKSMGRERAAEGVLRRTLDLSIRAGQVLSAAKAASNLAVLLTRCGRTAEVGSLLSFTRRCYRSLGNEEGLLRTDLARAMLDSTRLMTDEAVDRLTSCIVECVDRAYVRERIIAELMLCELFLRKGDFEKAEMVMNRILSDEASIMRFRALEAKCLYLRGTLLRASGDLQGAEGLLRRAESLRKRLGIAFGTLNDPGGACKAYRIREGIGSRIRVASRPSPPYCKVGSMSSRNIVSSIQPVESQPPDTGCGTIRPGDEYQLGFITCNPRLISLLEEIRRAAPLSVPVLLTGESGVGKEVLGRLAHRWSGREAEPFVAVNAAALPRDLFESSLFGHSKGAFTGAASRNRGFLEAAGGGTVFLDEIGELEAPLQAKLLRLLDSGEYIPVGECEARRCRARIITATNRDIESLVAAGSFRADLYYRLSTFNFHILPLRERRCDIGLLADHFLARICREAGLGRISIGDSVLSMLERHTWPGNARELKSEITRAAVKARGSVLEVRHLSANILASVWEPRSGPTTALDDKRREFERGVIISALQDAGGNRTRAAEALGLKRTTLLYRIKRLGLDGR